MLTNQLKWLRLTVVALLVFLLIQFELGMAINLSDLPNLQPFPFSIPAVLSALNLIGSEAILHTVLGTVLTVLSLVNLVMSLSSKVRVVQVFGVLGCLSMFLAATSGVLFTISGFQDDNYSHGMATNFILTFGFHFLELYVLKPKTQTQSNPVVE